MSRGRRIHAEPDEDAARGYLLAPPQRWTPLESLADASGAEGDSDIYERVERHADGTEDQDLYGQRPILRLAELRQEGQEEKRGLRVQRFGQDALSKGPVGARRGALG